MRIAITYENGNIFQHFGRTEQFKVYDAEDGKVVSEQVIGNDGYSHGALAGFLASRNVDVLICGGIGGGGKTAVAEAGIELYGGVAGSADEAVAALLAGTLANDPDARCEEHDEGKVVKEQAELILVYPCGLPLTDVTRISRSG